jgi:uncharacterized protein with PIN domain
MTQTVICPECGARIVGMPKETDEALLRRAKYSLENCGDCGCAECVRIYHELIRSLTISIRDLLDQRMP